MGKVPVISIIDDDASVREATGGLVRSLGYQADTFASAEEFLHSDGLGHSACVITDVNMPGLSGIGLQRLLKARGQHTPIIFITALTEDKVRARVLSAGAVGFLRKPFKEECLIDFLDFALSGTEFPVRQ